MAKKSLTMKQKIFADELIKTKNKTKAAQKAYPDATYGSQRMIGVDNMTKPNIIEYIKSCAPEAFNTVLEIMHKEKTPEAVRLNAAKDILDRAGLKPTDKQEITGANGTALQITRMINDQRDQRGDVSGDISTQRSTEALGEV